MSALPPKADIGTQSRDVRFVPEADSCSAAKRLISRLQSQVLLKPIHELRHLIRMVQVLSAAVGLCLTELSAKGENLINQ